MDEHYLATSCVKPNCTTHTIRVPSASIPESPVSSEARNQNPLPNTQFVPKDPTFMTARAIHCCLPVQREMGLALPAGSVKLRQEVERGRKQQILLQPRLCTLRSYGEDQFGVLRKTVAESTFTEKLFEYIESSNKSHEVEILSGRLAMVVFAATVGMEIATGSSVFKKMDMQGMVEAAGVCLGAVALAAVFACFSGARNQVGRIFTIRCNSFIDSLIDQVVDGLFYDSELCDWSDEG